MEDSKKLIVAYDGKALEDHTMDIQELAFALVGLGDVLTEANNIINKGSCKTTVKVSSGFKAGSFEIHLIMQQVSEYLALLGTNPELTGINQILSLLGFGGFIGLIQLIKKLKNGRIKNIKELDNNQINITYITDNSTQNITIEKNVYILYENTNLRNSLKKVLKPLESEGIDTFEIRNEKKEILEKIEKSEIKYFDITPTEDTINENITDIWLNLVNVSFKDGNKWRLSNGDSEFYATIEDNEFLYQINNNLISFSKSDSFKASVKTTQILTEDGIKTNYSILKILEYKSIMQMKLDLYKKENND
ncbi:MAG: hypothetical protein PHC64_02710 [Candidatus Gastranaerophilales bacterium]|nr:hypothetical protein [Candidatus Gastranaerophilales bacterium]